jgi:hypothetical protein
LNVLEEIKDGVKRFFEEDTEVKKAWYTRDKNRSCIYDTHSVPKYKSLRQYYTN